MNNTPTHDLSANPIPVLALRAKAAAPALNISPRLLATLTATNNIPHFHIGRAVLYPVAELKQWLSEQVSEEGQPSRT